jgi:hypothetical protein
VENVAEKAGADALTPRIVNMIGGLVGDLHHLDQRIDQVTGEIETLAMMRLANG